MVKSKKNILNMSSNDILVANLQSFIVNAKIHEAELARQTKIPQPTLHKILTGKTTDPRISTLQILADYFGTTLDALYTNTELKNSIHTRSVKPIPIISWIECIHFSDFSKKISVDNLSNWVVVDSDHAEKMFALKSKASIEPRFPRGTIFIIDAKCTPSDGDLVVVHYPDTKECTLRELTIDGRAELLLSLNGNSKPELLSKSIKIIGVVVQSRFCYQEENN